MSAKIQSIGVLTSGGDSPGMNAAIRAVVRTSIFYHRKIFGVYRGYDGLIQGDYIDLNAKSVNKILNLGGTILKSARSEEFMTKEGRNRAYEAMRKAGIDALVTIGGNGTFTGAQIFQDEFDIPVIGIPGTIDNDLYGTDFTVGFDTATNTVIEAVDKIRDTASSHNRLFIVEVMGRDAGFIALRSGLATGALAMVLPEDNASMDDLVAELERGAANKKTSNIVITAEGNKLGNSFEIAEKIKEHFPQIDCKVTILGHLQRGGSPSCFDRILASRLGVAAVEGLLNDKRGKMAGIVDDELTFTDLQQAVKNKAQLNNELLRISKILSI
jgi:6-phosphofructokinase 1